ncbi:hypothetical protein L1887_54017 [Cichorium endivia]|nr:hypothetical protein L1887_54017 [Cichorium endivia]
MHTASTSAWWDPTTAKKFARKASCSHQLSGMFNCQYRPDQRPVGACSCKLCPVTISFDPTQYVLTSCMVLPALFVCLAARKLPVASTRPLIRPRARRSRRSATALASAFLSTSSPARAAICRSDGTRTTLSMCLRFSHTSLAACSHAVILSTGADTELLDMKASSLPACSNQIYRCYSMCSTDQSGLRTSDRPGRTITAPPNLQVARGQSDSRKLRR